MKRFILLPLGLAAWLSTSVYAAPSWWPFAAPGETNAPAATAPAKPAAVQVDPATVDRGGVPVTTSFAPIVKKVLPSVVTIYTSKKLEEQAARGGNPLANDPFFQRFFGRPNGPGNSDEAPQARPRPRYQKGLGSGVIISADGYIVTNVHVVDVADEVKVKVTSGHESKEYLAKVIGKDPLSDVALVKIEAKDLPALVFADSAKVEVGDVVLAVGNPFALSQTVTMGIVSGLGRGEPEGASPGGQASPIEDFIQTDAAINPGNSGGPLVDVEGRMIGLNSQIYSSSGGYMGIGFAIPSNMVHDVIDSLLKRGHVVRGYLGVEANSGDSQDLLEKFNIPSDTPGVLVAGVQPNSAAAAAGVKIGDYLVEFNGKPVDDYRTLRLAVTATAPGQPVKMRLIRDGKEKTLDVTLKEFAPDTAKAKGDESAPAETAPDSPLKLFPGVEVADLSPEFRRQVGAVQYPADLKGAVVTAVDPDSAAAVPGGLQPGEVIVEVERKPVASAQEAIAAAKGVKKGLLLRVWSKGNPSRFVYVKN